MGSVVAVSSLGASCQNGCQGTAEAQAAGGGEARLFGLPSSATVSMTNPIRPVECVEDGCHVVVLGASWNLRLGAGSTANLCVT